MKKTILFLALCLLTVSSFAQTLKDTLKGEYKPYFDAAVKAIEDATGKTSIYGIPYSFIESIILLVVVGVVVGMHKKAQAEQTTAHKEIIQSVLDAHAKTVETITKK